MSENEILPLSSSSNSMSKQQEDDDKVEWGPEHEEILIDWADKALCLRWLHAKSNNHYSRLNTWYTVPVIIMSTVTGTANFALNRFPADYQDIATSVIGSINIIAGIITTISQFLKIAELNEAHRASALAWSKLYRNIKLELAKAPKERKKVIHMLNNSKEEYDRLMETSPVISEKFIKMFKATFSGEVATKKEKKQASKDQQILFNNLHKPEVCDFIEPTKSSVYVPPPPLPKIVIDTDRHSNASSLLSSNFNYRPTAEEILQKEHDEKIKQQQQRVQDFNRRFKEAKQRNPTNSEISDNFDNLIPLEVITSVLDDISEYNQRHQNGEFDDDKEAYGISFT